MQIHNLAFAALGPFAGEHRIDFDGLGGAALFLIDGPTGAGKSAIIDAIVFALYGGVAGRSSDRQRLRSDFAGAEQASFAEVEFSTSAGRFRVHRQPEYQREKMRGTGTTRSASSILLFRSTGPGGWEPVSRNKGDTDAEIERIIGLSSAQFLQTVVLPQGEFANFLAAESKDRLTVLERIFATDLYSRMEQALDEQRRSAEEDRADAVRKVADSVQHVRSRLSDVDLETQPVDVDLDAADDIVVAGLDGLLAGIRLRLAVETSDVQLAAVALAEASDRVDSVRARASAQDRVALAQERLDAAISARVLATGDLDAHATALHSVGGTAEDPAGAVTAVDQVIGALNHVLEAERRLPHDVEAVVREEAIRGQLDATIASLDSERDRELPARLMALSRSLSDVVAAARASALAAVQREAHLVQARLDGMAAELAEDLAAGMPCPVCGAAEHPAPAERLHEAVKPADLAAAGRERFRAEGERSAVELQEARLGDIAADLPDGGSAAQATDELEVADERVLTADEITSGIRDLQQRINGIERELVTAREQRAANEVTLAQCRATLADHRALVGTALEGYATVGERVAALTSLRTALRSVLEAGQSCAESAQSLTDARTARDEVLALHPAMDDDEASVETLAANLNDRRVEHQDAVSQQHATSALLADLVTRVGMVGEAFEVRDAVVASTADVIAVASIVRGGDGNVLAQPLSAFVVQTMFDEILEAANRRLRAMLDGRFELKSTEQRTGRKTTGLGLGLEVRDLRTDSVRKTATLSGGETFCASLALALGLADTVRSHAGGVEIGMLFIDEGFGSLDGDRLDDVMAELLRLRADGRTVGVISHVSEMKKSILERIDVQPLGGRLGSTLAVSWTT